MAFRADEEANSGYEQARRTLVLSPGVDLSRRVDADRALEALIDKHGPVVRAYPIWHPLVPQKDPRMPLTRPGERSGYIGLEHTVFFAHAFVTCPYGDGENVIKSVQAMDLRSHYAVVRAKRLEAPFYNSGTTPVLVYCDWEESFQEAPMVPKRLAVPLMVQQSLRMWPRAEVGERWENMTSYFLGEPHGARSSLFVTQDTALAMKRVYVGMVESGMFGPLHLD